MSLELFKMVYYCQLMFDLMELLSEENLSNRDKNELISLAKADFSILTYGLKFYRLNKRNEEIFMSIIFDIECKTMKRASVIVEEKNDSLLRRRRRLFRKIIVTTLMVIGIIILTLILV